VAGERDGGECGPEIWAQADRDGPGTEDEMVVEVGHHIDISTRSAGDSGWIEEAWIVEGPERSLGFIHQPNERSVVFVPDVLGSYSLRVVTTDGRDCERLSDLFIEVVLPDARFVAWTVWREPIPTRRVIDTDLYVARATVNGYLWQEEGFYVGPPEETADFGNPDSRADDPFLNQDYNSQGYGPERIIIREPSGDEMIAIGVNAFATATRDPARVRLQIYLEGELSLDSEMGLYAEQFWLAAETLGTELLGEYDLVTRGFPPPESP
jgi:hypothetical protein